MNVEQIMIRGRELDKTDDKESQKEEVRRDWFLKLEIGTR
jgi:hypothetical protein